MIPWNLVPTSLSLGLCLFGTWLGLGFGLWERHQLRGERSLGLPLPAVFHNYLVHKGLKVQIFGHRDKVWLWLLEACHEFQGPTFYLRRKHCL